MARVIRPCPRGVHTPCKASRMSGAHPGGHMRVPRRILRFTCASPAYLLYFFYRSVFFKLSVRWSFALRRASCWRWRRGSKPAGRRVKSVTARLASRRRSAAGAGSLLRATRCSRRTLTLTRYSPSSTAALRRVGRNHGLPDGKRLSRQHCQFWRADGAIFMQDGSSWPPGSAAAGWRRPSPSRCVREIWFVSCGRGRGLTHLQVQCSEERGGRQAACGVVSRGGAEEAAGSAKARPHQRPRQRPHSTVGSGRFGRRAAAEAGQPARGGGGRGGERRRRRPRLAPRGEAEPRRRGRSGRRSEAGGGHKGQGGGQGQDGGGGGGGGGGGLAGTATCGKASGGGGLGRLWRWHAGGGGGGVGAAAAAVAGRRRRLAAGAAGRRRRRAAARAAARARTTTTSASLLGRTTPRCSICPARFDCRK